MGIDDCIFLLSCPQQQPQQEIETLTWSEASHSDRFLQGRVEFSFSSHVPSGVQKRYACPRSTARSKASHGVSGRRAKSGPRLRVTLLPPQSRSRLEGEAGVLLEGCFACSPPTAAHPRGWGAAWQDTAAEGPGGEYSRTPANGSAAATSLKQFVWILQCM